MRSSILASALMAAVVVSKPLDKRYLVTVEDTFTVYETVTLANVPAPTAAAGGFFPISDPGFSTVTTVTVTSGDAVPTSAEPVVVPVETPTAEPVETPAEAPEAPVTPTTAVAAAPPASSASGANKYQNDVLNQHNNHRANHSASALTWSDSLAATAQKIAQSCVYAHDTKTDGGGYGQNIGAGSSADEVGSMITNMMYNGEIESYPLPFGNDNPSMSKFEHWGHFSQIVWKGTTEIGCATVECGSLANVDSNVPPVFTVCNYSPPGNIAGHYSNVGAPLGNAVVTV